MIAAALLFVGCEDSADAILRVEKSYLIQDFGVDGGSIRIPVRATGPFSADVETGNWCQASVSGVYVQLDIEAMPDGKDRSTKVTISSGKCRPVTVSVSQTSILVEQVPESVALSNSVRTFSLTIQSATKLNFTHPDWISSVDGDWEISRKTYTFLASEAESDREGTFVVTAEDSDFTLEIPVTQVAYSNAGISLLKNLWKKDIFQSSPLQSSSTRYTCLSQLETEANKLSPTDFKAYIALTDENKLKAYEEQYAILACYRYAFENAVSEIASTVVEEGSAVIWMLYNMGFVVKTPSVCFGFDVNHLLAKQLEPYLDFLCVSHSDNDHKDDQLNAAMTAAGKPVLSNFYTSNSYVCREPSTFNIKGCTITTTITDENATDLMCTTVHRIKCGEDAGGFEIIHTGDSSYDRSQFTGCLDGSSTNVLILRYGNIAETNILGTAAGQVVPDYILFSHLEELRHNVGSSPARATIRGAIQNMYNFSGTPGAGKTYLPFWGEKMVWKNGKLQ